MTELFWLVQYHIDWLIGWLALEAYSQKHFEILETISSNKYIFVRFQVLTAASMMFRVVFWDVKHRRPNLKAVFSAKFLL
jgi:hypothetical protein